MSRFTNDADNVQLALEQSVVSLLSSVLMFVGIVVVMLVVSPLLFLVSVVTLGAPSWCSRSSAAAAGGIIRSSRPTWAPSTEISRRPLKG